MKFNVITGERLDQLVIGYGLVYESKDSQDQGIDYRDILKKELIRVGIIFTIHKPFTRNPENGHLGIFPQFSPAQEKDQFNTWLQETYGEIPSKAEYLFE
jgi:hypothetical protein